MYDKNVQAKMSNETAMTASMGAKPPIPKMYGMGELEFLKPATPDSLMVEFIFFSSFL